MGHSSVPTGNLKVLNALAPVLALAALRASQPGVPAGASSRSCRPASRSEPTLPQKYCYIFYVMTSCESTPRWPSRSERPRAGCPHFRHGGARVGRTGGGSVANPGASPPCGMHGGPQPARRLPAPSRDLTQPLPRLRRGAGRRLPAVVTEGICQLQPRVRPPNARRPVLRSFLFS